MLVSKVKVISLPYIFQVLYVLCFTNVNISGERLQDQWSSGLFLVPTVLTKLAIFVRFLYAIFKYHVAHYNGYQLYQKNLFIILGYVQSGSKCNQTSYRLKQN